MSRRSRMAGVGQLPPGALSPEKLAHIRRRLEQDGLASERPVDAVRRRTEDGPARLSYSQEALWFIDRLDPGKPTYNIPCAVRLSGDLDVSALQQSLGDIVRRHEILRTVIEEGPDGVPAQVARPMNAFRLPVEDLSQTPPGSCEAEVRRRALAYGQAPFDLTSGPLFDAALLRLAPTEHVLLMRIHQLVTDGWSFGVFTRELETNYEAYRAGSQPSLPPLPLQYSDYASWHRDRLEGPAYERLMAYWRGVFRDGVSVLRLPTDRPRPPVQSFAGAHYPVRFSRSLSDELRALSRREGVTLFVTLLAAFVILMSRYSRQDEITVGAAFAGRTRRELEGLIGYFVTVLPLLARLDGNHTFAELQRQLDGIVHGAAAHQDMPLPKLVQEFEGARNPGANPLFQVVFYLMTPDHNPFVYGFGISPGGDPEEMAGLTLTPIATECGIARFDIQVLLWDLPSGVSGTFEYSTDLFDSSTIRRMTDLYEGLLTRVVRRADAGTAELVATVDRDDRRLSEFEHEASKRRMRDKLKSLKGRARHSRRSDEPRQDAIEEII